MGKEDPFDFILEEAGTISSSQEEILRRSRFIRNPRAASSSSDDDNGGGLGAPAATSCRISDHPLVMRSASDSDHSSSSSSDAAARGGNVGEFARQQDGPRHRPALESGGPAEVHCKDCGDGGEGLGLPGIGGKQLIRRSKGKQSWVSKRNHTPEEGVAEKDGSPVAAGRGKKSRALSDESTQEPEVVSSCGVQGDGLRVTPGSRSPVTSSSGKLVAKRLEFSGSGKDRSTGDGIALLQDVRPVAPPFSFSPPELLKGTVGCPKPTCGGAPGALQKLSPVAQNPVDEEVIKRPSIGSPKKAGMGTGSLHSLPPSVQNPADGDASASSARVNSSPQLEDEEDERVHEAGRAGMERPLLVELGTSPPVQVPQQPEDHQGLERGSDGCARSPLPPAESLPEGGPAERMLPSDLVDIMLKFSKKSNERLENVDWLDVLAMKGIHIPPPIWWRPGGYSPPRE